MAKSPWGGIAGPREGLRGALCGSQGIPGRRATLRVPVQPGAAEVCPLTSWAQQQLQRLQNPLQTAYFQSSAAHSPWGCRHDWSGTRHLEPTQGPRQTRAAAILSVAGGAQRQGRGRRHGAEPTES